MSVLTGATAELRYQGARIGKCRDFSVSTNRDALETTCLGEWDRTFIAGLRGSTGSATVLYDPEDAAAVGLLNSIYKNEGGAEPVRMIMNTATRTGMDVDAIITNVSAPVAFGQAVACSVSFQITGAIQGGF